MSAHDDENDEAPTMIDPSIPTGTRDRPARFDPHARLKDNRAATPPGGRPVVAEVISQLGPVRHDDPALPKTRAPSNFDPHNRIDDSSRTVKWAPKQVGAAQPEPATEAAHGRVEGPSRAKAPTRRGHDAGPGAPSAVPPSGPSAPPRDRSEPMRVISMKTPADLEAEKAQRVLPVVKLRAISEVHRTPPRGMGNLAPPRDPREARSRRVRDNVIWGSVAVILASLVTLAIWFLARR